MTKQKLTREDVERIVKEAREKGERIDLSGTNLGRTNLSGMSLNGTDLSRAILINAKLNKTTPISANLTGAILNIAHLRNANLSGANLFKADFSRADLSEATLINANLHGANLSEAVLKMVNLDKAILTEADLREASLSEAVLGGADFSKTIVLHTVFGDVDLSSVNGLETVQHWSPSTVGLDTIVKSKGKISEVFLRGCGLSDVDIEYAKLHNPNLTKSQINKIGHKIINLLTGDAIKYNSCFISYSHKDKEFAEKLYNNLQNNGVRCWYAPENLKIGDKIRPTINQSIRVHDKLLLVLSEHSVTSEWVEHEVEHALDLEIERGELMLYPIRLDDTVLRSTTGWAGNIKRSRHIGDFTRWKDHDADQQAFDRLLRDLKTDEPLPLPPHLATENVKHKRRDSLRTQLAQHYSNLNKLQERNVSITLRQNG